jgi:hypothetical protein
MSYTMCLICWLELAVKLALGFFYIFFFCFDKFFKLTYNKLFDRTLIRSLIDCELNCKFNSKFICKFFINTFLLISSFAIKLVENYDSWLNHDKKCNAMRILEIKSGLRDLLFFFPFPILMLSYFLSFFLLFFYIVLV